MRGGSKAFYMLRFGPLYIKCSLIVLENGVVPFSNKYLVDSSQKKNFITPKIENDFDSPLIKKTIYVSKKNP